LDLHLFVGETKIHRELLYNRDMIAIALLAVLPAISPVQSPAVPKTGFRAEFLRDLSDVEKKIEDLAAAMPPETYKWRPAPGVRSASEVYMHIAGGNYFLGTFVGMKPPAYDEESLEKITDKQRILAELRKSFAHIRTAALNASDADLDKPVKMFGTDTTVRGAFIEALVHLHEHLGQSIAYARMNGIVPPWSAAP